MADKRKYRDRAEYIKQAVDKRRKKLRSTAVRYKGGQCFLCGYNKCVQALEFHHPEPNRKDFGISASGTTRAWPKIKRELDKCVMLCANCHREVHVGIRQLSVERRIEKRGELSR